MNETTNLYPRGKSWNWHKRAIKRGDPLGYLWFKMRETKRVMVRDLGKRLYGSGSGVEFDGLDLLIDDSVRIKEII